jgi:hypothetical protein
VKPIWGRDESVEVAPFSFGVRRAVIMLDLLGVPRTMWPPILDQLNALATQHKTWRRQELGRAARRQSNRALLDVAETATRFAAAPSATDRRILRFMLCSLCDQADVEFRSRLADLAVEVPLGRTLAFGKPEALIDRPDLIAAAARQAHRRLSTVRGPDTDCTLHITVGLLVDMYEGVTGLTATCTRAIGGIYSQQSQSRAGRFISFVMAELEPELPPSRVSNALRLAIRHRKLTSNGQSRRPERSVF